MVGEEETFFQCPYCFEQVSMIFETQYGKQTYIEDCEVCCAPIEVMFEFREGELINLEIKRAQ